MLRLDVYLRTFVPVLSDKSLSLDSLKKLTAKCMNRWREGNLQASEILFFLNLVLYKYFKQISLSLVPSMFDGLNLNVIS